jgi:cell division protein YceG involved in septum cleavage
VSEFEWGDPLAGDEAARERERRRAERRARRLERDAQRPERAAKAPEPRGALADRVRGLRGSQRPGDGKVRTPPPPADRPPQPPEPPRPPRGPTAIRRRRVLFAIAAAVALVAAVIAIVAVIRDTSAGGTPHVTTETGPVKQITIPEGYDREQIAEVARKAGITGDYLSASHSFRGFDPARYGAEHPASLEGFLFPATYQLPRHPTADDLVVRQLAAFKQYLSKVDMSYARSKNLTTYDVLTIGSMIEREVQVPKERSLVAAVIYNRLQAGMPLQIDATIRYATGNYTEPLTESELQVNSPYNTYTNMGLPPGPIDNPGLASIRAAAHPAQVPYLYYVVKPGTCPARHTFATTEAGFERAKAAYEQARAAAGGKSPTC